MPTAMKFKERLLVISILPTISVFVYVLLSERISQNDIKSRIFPVEVHDWCFNQFADKLIPDNGIHTENLIDRLPVDSAPLRLRFDKNEPPNPPLDLGPLRVFVIPHSHNDPGWIKTLDRYYQDETINILNNLVKKLTKNQDMTFVWSETVFLSLWWRDISNVTKAKFKKLIERGQLELVTGGWVDPDEAVTHYVDIIDEMMEGHRWLEKNVGVKPEVYWAPDPFGYSSTMPYLLKRAGFKRMVILRVHEGVKSQLRKHQNLEFIWRQTWDKGDRGTDMFTHLLPYTLYTVDQSCGPDPYICGKFDFKEKDVPDDFVLKDSELSSDIVTMNKHNIETYARYLVDQFRAKSLHYKHNVIFMPLGDDFRFASDMEWSMQYKNYKLLIDHINKRKEWNVVVSFGTISDYFRTLESDEKYWKHSADNQIFGESWQPHPPNPTQYPVLYGDFYPYMDRDKDYWTGFYTTRPFWKGLSRELQADIRSAEVLNSLASAYSKYNASKFQSLTRNFQSLKTARRDIALFQHHDGITGTSKRHVVVDYGERLWRAKKLAQLVKLTSAAYILSDGKVHANSTVFDRKARKTRYVIDIDTSRVRDSYGPGRTIITSVSDVKVIFFNSLAHSRREIIKLHVDSTNISVCDDEGRSIRSQIMPIFTTPLQPDNRKYELVFLVEIRGLGFRSYNIRRVHGNATAEVAAIPVIASAYPKSISWPRKERLNSDAITVKNDFFVAVFDREWGLLHSMKFPDRTIKTIIRFLCYSSSRSGAYLFFPRGKADAEMFVQDFLGKVPMIYVIRGPVISEVRVSWDFLKHTARVYHSTIPQGRAVELINEFDISKSTAFKDKEVIMRVHTDIQSREEFYTDSNGYQMIRRKYRERLPIGGNYYPMTTLSYIQDEFNRFSIVSKQSHGVSSLESGQIEVMLDRRLSFDDGRGLGQGVEDNQLTIVKFLLLVEAGSFPSQMKQKNSYPSLLSHQLSTQFLNPLNIFYQMIDTARLVPVFTPLTRDLPCDLHLVNLKTMFSVKNEGEFEVAIAFHRLGYQCEYTSDGLSCFTDVSQLTFDSLFTNLRLVSVKEQSLTLMHGKKELTTDSLVNVEPMEIATFYLTFK